MTPAIQSDGDWRFALASQMSLDGFWELHLPGNYVNYSPRWQQISGFPAEEFAGGLEHWIDRVHPHDHARLVNHLRALRQGNARIIRSEHRLRDASGAWRWVMVRAIGEFDNSGHAIRIAGSITDQTERKTEDGLTGLPNRSYFLDHLERRIDDAGQGAGWNFAILSLALERFKMVNEHLGYAGGDALLMEIAARLTSAVKQGERRMDSVVARLGGAEFLVCLEDARSEAEALEAAGAMREVLRQPFQFGHRRFQPSVAVGLTKAEPRSRQPEDLLHEADAALVEAKSNRHGKLICYSNGMRERARARLQAEADLDLAIRTGQLELHYQPEIDLRTRQIVGFEALVRWNHPERGLLQPGEFITMAEETGLILPLGEWGLREACRQIVEWQRLATQPGAEGAPLGSSALRVSVNLSARQFGQPGLVSQVADVLAAYEISSDSLRLEVTEGSLMADSEQAMGTMKGLQALGVGLHMDDFGTGYSSLNYLQTFPFDTLKIDRSFVQGLFDQKGSAEIVKAIITLAHSLGMQVVAEGIETGEQLAHLQALDCQLGQGYFFARPMHPDAISCMLTRPELASAVISRHLLPAVEPAVVVIQR
jgi:diguanylate cyclase (GGDEF)-like protein/PAS domain S-box-containing protein